MQKEGGTPHSDQRGRHEPPNKTSEARIRVVKEHIEMFPRYRSHYSHKANPHREYLSPDLTVTKIRSLYQDFCKNNHAAVSECVYRKVFTTFSLEREFAWLPSCLKQPAQATILAHDGKYRHAWAKNNAGMFPGSSPALDEAKGAYRELFLCVT